MRIHVLSDLHLGVRDMARPAVDADVTILAGDIARPADAAMRWAAGFGRPVLYVPGNHEFYGGSIPGVRRALADSAHRHGVHMLDEACTVIDDVRFAGTTLWTDFQLFGPRRAGIAMADARRFMRDFSAIRNGDGSPFTPADACTLFAGQHAWLASILDEPFAGPTVVVTHHAPSIHSVPERFADSALSAAFASDCTGLMGKAVLWIHGHLHDSFDYSLRGTRVVCNPRGYAPKGVNENAQFDPAFCIDLATG